MITINRRDIYKVYYEERRMIMQKDKLMKLGGIVLTLAGAGISLATSMLEDKKLDAKVTEKVAEALSKE